MSSQRLEELRKTTNLSKTIKSILDKKFIHTQDIAAILASAIYSKQNVILYGPGGHGKSEMVECVLEGLGLWNKQDPSNSPTLVQSFGEGLTEDALWGGIDFKKLNNPQNPEMWFNVENSFLNYPVAVFEELFDAPAFCLLPLKHTLQSGFLAKNGRSYPMSTEIIIACTNRAPEEIGEMGETYRALLERFVLRQEVAWAKYDTRSYLALIKKHKYINRLSEDIQQTFAGLVAQSFDTGNFISPRTAMKAIDTICGAASASGRDLVIADDLISLTHVAGFAAASKKLKSDIDNMLAAGRAEALMSESENKFNTLTHELESKDLTAFRIVEFCILAKKYLNLQETFNNMSVPDSLYDRKVSYTRACSDKSNFCMQQALQRTRV